MSAVAVTPRRARRRRSEPSAGSLFDALPAQEAFSETAPPPPPTLDDVLSGLWTELEGQRAVACPVCGEAMTPEIGTEGEPLGGRCASCQSSVR
ncbi:MAG: hypothetical protein JOZ07_12380 [Solirubrobacterales bacterium]|nr:hypothetical protein [Solirubrobacterales bacterium]